MKSFIVAATVAAITLLLTQGDAHARPGDLVYAGCQVAVTTGSSACVKTEGLDDAEAVAFSADGRSAYAGFPNGISVFDRDPATGFLTLAQCLSVSGAPPCAAAPGLQGNLRDIAVSRDGLSVYAGTTFETLLGFKRAGDGRLSFAFCQASSYGPSDQPGCPVGGFQETRQVEISSDDRSVLVSDNGCTDNTGECFAAIGTYSRDPSTSLLKDTGYVAPRFNIPGPFTTGGNGIYQLETGRLAITSYIRKGDASYRRTGCITRRKVKGCRYAPEIAKPRAIDLNGNGTKLAVAGNGRVAVFARSSKGKLRLKAQLGLKSAPLRKVSQVKISMDGRSLYVVGRSQGPDVLVRFGLNLKKRKITRLQTLAVFGLARIEAVDRFVYGLSPAAPGRPAFLHRLTVEG